LIFARYVYYKAKIVPCSIKKTELWTPPGAKLRLCGTLTSVSKLKVAVLKYGTPVLNTNNLPDIQQVFANIT